MARLVGTQAGFELRVLFRNGEQLLLTIFIPVGLLLGLTLSTALPLTTAAGASRIDTALAGVLAVAVLSSAFTSLAIGVGFDRRSGALLLLATTPLSRTSILAAKHWPLWRRWRSRPWSSVSPRHSSGGDQNHPIC